MIELFQMWALVEVLGLVCLPLTITVFHNLPDRGWAFSKALGLAVFAFFIWFPLMCFRALPFNQIFILGAALLLLACNLLSLPRTGRSIIKLGRRNLLYIIVTEVIFLGMVFLLGWLRSYRPDIRSFEMFMDEGFIAAIMRSPHLPPNDMWFAGYPINYYYYAHFTIAALAKLLGQSPSIAFNTGICIFFGLTAANLFGVTCNVVSWARHLRSHAKTQPELPLERPGHLHPSLLPAIPYGLFTMLTGLVLGNIAAAQQWWQNHGDVASTRFDWFAPSRVIDNTINEFPAFSFLLSCFHAHVLALAFTIMAIALAFNLLLEPDGKGIFVFGRGWRLPFTLASTALVLGGLFAMNGWDFPTYAGLALICIAIQQWLAHDTRIDFYLVRDVCIAGISLVALSIMLYLPFYLTFISPAQGIGIVSAQDRSPLRDELLIYGLFAFLFVSLLLASAYQQPLFAKKQAAPKGMSSLIIPLGIAISLLLILLLSPNSLTFVLMTSVAILSLILMFYHIRDRAHAFTLLLGTIAFALIAGCEIFFLKDLFANQYPRMNTVFKFYFQAWALLSITSGCGLFFLLKNFWHAWRTASSTSGEWRWLLRPVEALWAFFLLLLLLASAVYPLLAPPSRLVHFDPQTRDFSLTRTSSLDGLTYLQHCRPPDPGPPDLIPFCTYDVTGDYAAIRWINSHIQGDPVIVEAVKDDYTLYGRISAFTGLPTLMGWGGHEVQWRVNWLSNNAHTVEFNQRFADTEIIYTNTDAPFVLSIMARYHAQYLYVGALERATYPMANLQRFSTFMQVVYQANGVTIYKVK